MSVLIDLDACLSIRKALLVGLHSFGEIERLDDAWQRLQLSNKELSWELRPIHPTGSAETVGYFSNALSAIDWIESELRKAPP